MDRSPLPVGEARTFALAMDAAAGQDISARATVKTADEGWLATGREPVWGEAREGARAGIEAQQIGTNVHCVEQTDICGSGRADEFQFFDLKNSITF